MTISKATVAIACPFCETLRTVHDLDTIHSCSNQACGAVLMVLSDQTQRPIAQANMRRQLGLKVNGNPKPVARQGELVEWPDGNSYYVEAVRPKPNG